MDGLNELLHSQKERLLPHQGHIILRRLYRTTESGEREKEERNLTLKNGQIYFPWSTLMIVITEQRERES